MMIYGRIFSALPVLLATFTFTAAAEQYPAVPGEYVVKLKPKSRSANFLSLEKALGATVKQTVSKDLALILVARPLIESQESVIDGLSHNPLVEYAEPNYIYRAIGGATTLPNDPGLDKLWGMVNTGHAVDGDGGKYQATAGVDIDAKRGWQIETGSNDVLVAVVDSGVNYREPDLVDNIYNNLTEINGKPGVDDDKNGYIDDFHGANVFAKNGDPIDVLGHGTHVSGTIGAKAGDGYGVVGVAWHVTILPVRFLDDSGGGVLSDAVTAIEYAIKMKAKIMNNSWGGGAFSQALLDVITKAKNAGILFVAAAGNGTNNSDASPTYPANYSVDNIISVAAIDPTGKLATFSNYGKLTVHIAAPGVDILSHTMKGLESWSGTSMATPHVTGVAALLLAQDKTQTYDTLRKRILNSARPLAGLRGKVQTGLLNAYYALTDQIAPLDPEDPVNWQRTAQKLSSPHPYSSNSSQSWTITVPGAKEVSVYFSKFQTEFGFDKVEFKDSSGKVAGQLSGVLGVVYGPVVVGDTVTLTLTSDKAIVDYGFDIAGVAYK